MAIGAAVFVISALRVGAIQTGAFSMGAAQIGVIPLNAAPRSVALSVGGALLFALNVCIGIGIRVNINLATTSLAFRYIEIGGFTNMIYNTQEFAKYPLEIYPLVIRVLLLTLIPHAVISYIPVCMFLGRLPVWPYALVPPASLAFITFLRRAIFGMALRHYESAGN
jgi:ABC-2 type transport system permease protein